ncbi:MAG TPA: hypothetical protein VK806_00620, partial [Bacteroidia bacterium]|nr:hypothetical protein [Bacteroidia bacterium]
MKRLILFTFFLCVSIAVFSQRGKNGNLTVSTALIVNEYTTLTADAHVGDSAITVASTTLNTKGRFSGNLAPGDLVFIIQIQGTSINGAHNPFAPRWATPNDSSWGRITYYNNCGNNEYAEVKRISGSTIVFNCELQHAYTDTGVVQVVRVPRYNSLTINSGGSISCDPWDSAKGGVVAIEVLNNTVVNSGGTINVSGDGFRGGKLDYDVSAYGVNNYSVQDSNFGKQKGEGIAGFEWRYNIYGGLYCRGAGANAGGGGDAHNTGGGGGANGGDTSKWINGFGNPDVSTANNIKAWNLEYTWMSTFTASGGGRGGYSFSGKNGNPLTTGPNNNGVWGGDARSNVGGSGGRPLDYSTGRLFLGGGGGAGDQDDGVGGAGGNGAGMVYLVSYGTV